MPRSVALLGLFLAASLCTRAPFLSVPLLDLDEAAHCVGSWELLRGGRLYTDFADNKPPLLYAYYALAQATFGHGLPAVRAFTAVWLLPLTALALSAFFRHDRRGIAAGLLYLVFGAAFLAHDMHAVHAEIVFLLPAAWAVCLVRDAAGARRATRLLAAGVLLGLAALVKQHAAVWLAVPAVVAWRGAGLREGLVRAGALAAGFLIPLGGAWLVFAGLGNAGDFVYWTFTWNLHYAANPIPPAEALLRLARGPLPFALVTAPLWWTAWRSRSALDAHQRTIVIVLAALALVTAAVGFRFFPHYLIPLYLPLALGAAPRAAAPSRALFAYGLAVLAGFTAANHVLYGVRTDVYEETSPLYGSVRAALMREAGFQGGTLFVWGYAPGFYYHLPELRPASRFVVPQATLSGYVAGNTASARGELDGRALIDPAHWQLLLDDLERNRATFILDTSPSGLHRWNHFPVANFPLLDSYLRARYDHAGQVGGVRLFRRKP
jgi:4-amino-4-deoxy-L-arabinose transferase-like glycosyltransferase